MCWRRKIKKCIFSWCFIAVLYGPANHPDRVCILYFVLVFCVLWVLCIVSYNAVQYFVDQPVVLMESRDKGRKLILQSWYLAQPQPQPQPPCAPGSLILKIFLYLCILYFAFCILLHHCRKLNLFPLIPGTSQLLCACLPLLLRCLVFWVSCEWLHKELLSVETSTLDS